MTNKEIFNNLKELDRIMKSGNKVWNWIYKIEEPRCDGRVPRMIGFIGDKSVYIKLTFETWENEGWCLLDSDFGS